MVSGGEQGGKSYLDIGSVSEAHRLVMSPGHPNHDKMGQPQGEPFTGTSHFSHNQMMQVRDEGPPMMPGCLSHNWIRWQPQGDPVVRPSHLNHNQMAWEQDKRPAAGPDHLSHNQIGWQPQGEPVVGPSHFNHNQLAQEQDDGPAMRSGYLDYGLMGWGQHGGSVADSYSWLRSLDSIFSKTAYQSAPGPFNQD